MSKEWPKDQAQLLDFEEVITPVLEALTAALAQTESGDIDYRGYCFGPQAAATVPDPDYLLSKENQEKEQEAGRTPLNTVLRIAFLLGMEQGRRQFFKEVSPLIKIAKSTLASDDVKMVKLILAEIL